LPSSHPQFADYIDPELRNAGPVPAMLAIGGCDGSTAAPCAADAHRRL